MVSGLFHKDRLLVVIKDFIYFPDNADRYTKIVCGYPQYLAATKLFENIKKHLKCVVDQYNNRRRDEAFINEVLDDVAEQFAKLLEELKLEKESFKVMGIDYEEKFSLTF